MKQDRADAFRRLRADFAEVYNELRRRGHEVIVEYDDPGNSYYIPRLVELDGRPCNVHLSVEVGLTTRAHVRCYYVKWLYQPSLAASWNGAHLETRNAMSPARLASWIERVTSKEGRDRRVG